MEKQSTAAIREAAAQWTLAGDKQLLDILQNIHQGLMTRCQEVNQRLDEMVAALDDASVDLQNVNNKFMALSNSQFIESRVYDDDADLTAREPAKELPKPLDSSPTASIRASVHVLHGMHETIRILPSDTESDSDDEDAARIVLKPKDMYSERPLPYIIGSPAWKSKWHAGLLVEESDSDSVASERGADLYSDSEPETPRAAGCDGQESMTGSEVMSEQDLMPPAKPSSADVAAELARRLRGDLPEIPDEEVDFSPVPPASKKVYRPEKPTPGVIFSDDPPPFDGNQSEEDQYSPEEDDDIFAELHKNKPYTNNIKVQNAAGNQRSDLKFNKDYQGDLFDDSKDTKPAPPLANQKSTLFEDESESELFAPTNTVRTTAEKGNALPNVETVKKPIGGISLFGSNKGTESIGAAILKRHQRKSSSDEEKPPKETPKPTTKADILTPTQKDIFNNLFAKSVNENKTTKDIKETNIVKEEGKVNQVDLFTDNIFDDIDDIFTSDVVKVTTKSSGDKQKSLFDDDNDDDLFSGIAVAKSKVKVKSDDIKKSLFESDDELFSDTKLEKTFKQASESISKSSISKTANSKENVITYEDESSDNDIFSKLNETKIFNASNVDKVVSKTQLPNSKKLSSEEIKNSADSLQKKSLTNNAINNNVTTKSSAQKSVAQDTIFGDVNEDSDDLFNETNNTTHSSNKVNQNNNVAKTIPNTANKTESENRPSKISLFDDDENDDADLFFSANNKALSNKVEAKNNETTKALGKEKGNMFNDNKNTDISNAPKKFENNNMFVNSVNKNNPDNNDKNDKNFKTDSSQHKKTVFNDDSDDNLFGKNDDNMFKKEHPVSTITADEVSPRDTDDNLAFQEKKQDNTLTAKEAIQTKHSSDYNSIKPPEKEDLIEQRNIIFNEDSIKPEIPEPDFSEPNPKYNEEDALLSTPKDAIFNVSGDIFSKITDEPPAFEKPKESKKSKNVNALFDDDSDDEALFFKKNDVVFDELPDVSADSNDPLFGIFHDEPPAIDVEFIPKGSDKNLKSLENSSKKTSSYNFNHEPSSDGEITTTKTFTENTTLSAHVSDNNIHKKFEELKAIDDFLNTDSDDTLFKTAKPVEKTTSKPIIATKPIQKDIETHTKAQMSQDNVDQHTKIDENTETVTSEIGQPSSPKRESLSSDTPDSPETKKISKLKTMNFNIDVSTLLPGASPKKKVSEQTDGHALSTNDQEGHIKNRKETMVKAVSFDGDPESQVLDNKISKERAKIQVKRRPSTRRARKDAVRQSVLDQGEDSTDNSNSIEDAPKVELRKETMELDNDSDLDQSVSSADHKEPFTSDVDPKRDIPPESDTIKDIFESNDTPIETVVVTKPETSSEIPTKSAEETKINTKADNDNEIISRTVESKTVTSKIVYILNDEDIFNTNAKKTKAPTSILNLSDDDSDDLFKGLGSKREIQPSASTLGNIYKDTSTEDTKTDDKNIKTTSVAKKSVLDLSDDEDELFNAKKVTKPKGILDSDSDEDLFSGKSEKRVMKIAQVKEVKQKVVVNKSLFGDDDEDDDLFGAKVKVEQAASFQPKRSQKEPATKPSEPDLVFDDPLSMLGVDDD